MNRTRKLLISLAAASLASASCAGNDFAETEPPNTAGTGTLTASGAGGTASTSGGSAAAVQGGSAGSGGVAGSLSMGGTLAGGTAGTSGGGANAGTSGSAGAGTNGGSGGSGPFTASQEDDGADCPVSALPEAGALTSIAKLPDPFKKLDGSRITTKAEWRCRRQEIMQVAEKFAYGSKPGKPQSVNGTVSSSSISVKVTEQGKSASFSATVKLPSSGSAPYPAIIVYGGAGFGSPLDSNVVNSEGVALISYDPYAVGKETGSRQPKAGAFYDLYGASSTTGLLMAWAWGVSRIIDAIAQSDGKLLQADAVGVTGCSRFGKGSFIAGVFDQRVALTMPVESGSAGVPIWRGIPGEGAQSLSSAYGEQPWFGDAFSAFVSAPGKAPLDTHEVVALIAPRGLFIMDNPHIANLGPKSASVAALGAAEIYKALGAGDNITYYSDVQNGQHCSERPEWSAPLRSNIRKFLRKTGSDAGVIKISSNAKGNLSDWRDWDTPLLQ